MFSRLKILHKQGAINTQIPLMCITEREETGMNQQDLKKASVFAVTNSTCMMTQNYLKASIKHKTLTAARTAVQQQLFTDMRLFDVHFIRETTLQMKCGDDHRQKKALV